MTFFRRLRRLRRPVAVVLLVCMISAFVLPAPSRSAIDPVTATIVVGGASMLYARYHLPINQAVQRYGSQAAYFAGRIGPWLVDKGKGLQARLGTFAQAGRDKIVGFANQAAIGLDKAWNWIKKHPGDAADIAGTVLDLIQALRGNGMPHTADVVERTFNPSSTTDDLQSGDLYEDDRCGVLQVEKVQKGVARACRQNAPSTDKSCTVRTVAVYPVPENHCNTPGYTYYKVDLVYFKKVSGTPSPSDPLPEELSPGQSDQLLNEIEKKLEQFKDEMERELDELLKKNIDDIDWPEFDNDAAKQYLRDNKRDDLLDELEKAQQELEQKRQERENQQNDPENQNNCQNKCCAVGCEESRLEDKIDRLKDKLDDLDREEQKEALDETYDVPPPAETELKSIDFQPIVDLKGEFMTKFPFNTLQLIPSAVQLLSAEPQAPSFVIDLGDVGGQHTVDFSVFDSLASFVRLTLTFLIYLAAVFCCLKIWSRL